MLKSVYTLVTVRKLLCLTYKKKNSVDIYDMLFPLQNRRIHSEI